MTYHYYFARLCLVVILVISMNTAISTARRQRLAEILQLHRQKCGSLKKLALSIGIKPGTLSTYLQADSYPDWLNLEKVATYLGISPKELETLLDGETFASKKEEYFLKAEEFFPMLVPLPPEEKILLAKHLLNAAL